MWPNAQQVFLCHCKTAKGTDWFNTISYKFWRTFNSVSFYLRSYSCWDFGSPFRSTHRLDNRRNLTDRGRQESSDPAMFLLGFQKRDSETVNRRIAGPLRIPPSTHSKPCLPSTGSSSHTATKTHFAPDEQQLWGWKHICSLRAAPAERLQNCSSVQARRNSKGPTEYSKLPVFFCAVAMWERWKNIALV